MTETYALVIRIQSYEYDDEFYFTGGGMERQPKFWNTSRATISCEYRMPSGSKTTC